MKKTIFHGKIVNITLLIILLVFCIYSQNYNDLSAFDLAVEEKHKTDSIAKFQMTDTEDDTINYYSDTITDSIYVSSETPQYVTILACECLIDTIIEFISQSKVGKELLTYNLNNQKLYMDHLLKYNIIDTITVKKYAKSLLKILKLQIKRNENILATQTGNTRNMIWRHIEVLKIKMRSMNSYVIYLNL